MSTKTAKQYKDAHGIDWDEVRMVLPGNPGDWEAIRKVPKGEACSIMHDLFGFCFLCSTARSYSFSGTLEAHHIISGSKKSDELCNIVLLCKRCHELVQSSPLEVPRVLRAKHKHDLAHTDWRRIHLLNRSWFPFDSLD